MTPVQMTIVFVVMALSLLAVINAGFSVYFAFFKKKDERAKIIVMKSMSHSFVVNLVLQAVLCVLKLVFGNHSYAIWWDNFKRGIYIEPVLLSLIIFGIALSINRKNIKNNVVETRLKQHI
jgi:hypothetical protein